MNFRHLARRVVFCLWTGCSLCAPAAAEDDSAYQNALRLLSEGRFDEARAAFQSVITQQKEHAGAWLDLAITQCGLGMSEEAETLFRHILERFDPPPAIRELIRQIRARGCQRQMRERLSSHRFELVRGHDGNVNQGATHPFSLGGLPLMPEFFPRGDDFTQMGLESTSFFVRRGVTLYARLQARWHDHLSRYDLTSGIAAVEQTLRPGSWEARLGATLGATRLGSRLYQKQAGVYAQISPPWPVLPAGWRYSFVSDVSRVRYPTLENFDANVSKHQFVLNFRNGKTRLTGSLGTLRDFGDTARPGGDKQGWSAGLTWRQGLGERFVGEFSWARQNWRGRRIYFSGLIDTNVRRDQHTTLWRAALIRSLDARHSLILEFRDLNNRENIGLFSYRGRQFMLGWQYSR
ncbi:MAG: tetratricopeptide repeat protein [Candidatus Accumulibacter sp.]|nr:tetratricopeptide repeat protein [Accumulibacter sp.]